VIPRLANRDTDRTVVVRRAERTVAVVVTFIRFVAHLLVAAATTAALLVCGKRGDERDVRLWPLVSGALVATQGTARAEECQHLAIISI
jgi:hypothetical protein